jgi:hypothetical protein
MKVGTGLPFNASNIHHTNRRSELWAFVNMATVVMDVNQGTVG